MGQFSWLTKEGKQIQIGQPVWMVFKSNDGSKVVVDEDSYEGYGEIGGVDYFNALYEMNFEKIPDHQYIHGWVEQREFGIDLHYIEKSINVEYPQFFTHSPSQREIDLIDWSVPCENDPDQGWAVDED